MARDTANAKCPQSSWPPVATSALLVLLCALQGKTQAEKAALDDAAAAAKASSATARKAAATERQTVEQKVSAAP